jgi:hypothetical protein
MSPECVMVLSERLQMFRDTEVRGAPALELTVSQRQHPWDNLYPLSGQRSV